MPYDYVSRLSNWDLLKCHVTGSTGYQLNMWMLSKIQSWESGHTSVCHIPLYFFCFHPATPIFCVDNNFMSVNYYQWVRAAITAALWIICIILRLICNSTEINVIFYLSILFEDKYYYKLWISELSIIHVFKCNLWLDLRKGTFSTHLTYWQTKCCNSWLVLVLCIKL